MKYFYTFIYVAYFSISSISAQIDSLRAKIHRIIQPKNAQVGVAILGLEDKDSMTVNGGKYFPMFSVYKFHTSLTVLHEVDKGRLSLEQKVFIKKADLNPNTFSPLRDERPNGDFEITVKELIWYAITKSDNIAFEQLVELLGGIQAVQNYVQQLGIKNVFINSTYKDTYEAILQNKTTPWATIQLLTKSYQENILSKNSKDFLWKTMGETTSGPDRLKGLLPKGTLVAHKTGTSGMDDKGINDAFNDVGIVTLPSGKHVVIAVFITQSTEDDATNANIIAEIAKTTWDYFTSKGK